MLVQNYYASSFEIHGFLFKRKVIFKIISWIVWSNAKGEIFVAFPLGRAFCFFFYLGIRCMFRSLRDVFFRMIFRDVFFRSLLLFHLKGCFLPTTFLYGLSVKLVYIVFFCRYNIILSKLVIKKHVLDG